MLGTATTIAVAWSLSVAFDPAAGNITGSVRWSAGANAPQYSLTTWWIWITEAPGTVMIQRAAQSDTPAYEFDLKNIDVPAWSELHRTPPAMSDFHGTFVEDARGWPRLCLVSRRQYGVYVVSGAAITPVLRQGLSLPWHPLWSGFAVDTCIYAVVWIMILFAPGAVRRVIRTRHGQCACCGYDLRGAPHAQCPECGTAVT